MQCEIAFTFSPPFVAPDPDPNWDESNALRRVQENLARLFRAKTIEVNRGFARRERIEGHTVTEIEVSNNPRIAGQSNYGVWNRLFATFYDLLAVRWMKKRMFKYKVAEKIN